MHNYEIEIKSLLGSKDKADELIAKMKAHDPELVTKGSHRQLNHYFVPTTGNLKTLCDKVKDLLDHEAKSKLENLANRAKDFSVRTRWADGKVILVVKASVDDTTSSNGTARLEFEAHPHFPSTLEGEGQGEGDASLGKLDNLVLASGFDYQAKWSRERQEFFYHQSNAGKGPDPSLPGINVSIDKNAGYGYLAEFEMVIDDASKADNTKTLIRAMMKDLRIEELPQDRLTRMFDYYNKNWRDYYGTDKIFVID